MSKSIWFLTVNRRIEEAFVLEVPIGHLDQEPVEVEHLLDLVVGPRHESLLLDE